MLSRKQCFQMQASPPKVRAADMLHILGFVDTRLYECGRRDCFVAFTPRDLAWARRMDHVLRQHLVLN